MTAKLNNNKSGAAKRHKETKRAEAIERQTARDSRTTEQQLRLVQTRPGNSAKEVKRLVHSAT